MEYLILSGLKFHSFIGHFDEEKFVGTNFEVDLKIKVDLLKAGKSDNLDDTLNNVEIYNEIKQIMQKKANLIENVAFLISDMLFEKYQKIEQISLIVKKTGTQIGGKLNFVATEFDFNRMEWKEKNGI